MSERTVVFEETGEERTVVKRCDICYPPGTTDDQVGCISSAGVEHVGIWDRTFCGHDATGRGWWWPL